MTIIDSANMRCNKCGVSANHPIMSMPDGWIVDRSTKPVQHFCSICSTNMQSADPLDLRKKSPMNRRSTDYQSIPLVSANIPGTQLCTKCGNKLFSKECWCYDDPVNHPSHYTSHPSGVECIQITEHFSFCIGNAIKYLWRADQKDGIQDLEKASWYINREIERRKNT